MAPLQLPKSPIIYHHTFCIFRDVVKDHIRVRTGDHDNKVADDYEQEFDVEELISHRLYDGKSPWHFQLLDHCHHKVTGYHIFQPCYN